LSAADITIPTGDLANGVYDSFGNFYPIPEYVVADPLNMAEVPAVIEDGDVGKSEVEESEDELKRKDEKGKGVMVELKARLSDGGGHDLVLRVGKDDSVRLVTRRILEASGVCKIELSSVNLLTVLQHQPPKHIKIAYRGKLLAPQQSLSEQGWQEGDIVNAMVFG
jgi:hypothetical protein